MKYMGDVTCLPLQNGEFLYLATVLDCFNRRVVGWSICIRQFAGLCAELGVTRSMGAVGSSADNAACESFHASLKRETPRGARDYGDATACRTTVFGWLIRYNTRRIRHECVSTITEKGPTFGLWQ